MNFTEETLKEYLLLSGVPVELWGKDGAKTISHLVEELRVGECNLNGPVRTVQSVAVDVLCNGMRLREREQIFKDGRVRQRTLPWGSVGEKLRPGETPNAGLWRALCEELDIHDLSPYRYKGEAHLVSISSSYPGLLSKNTQTRYVLYLRKPYFKPEGYVERQRDKTTYFDWVVAK